MSELLIHSVYVLYPVNDYFVSALQTKKLASIACVTSRIENRFRDLF